MPYLQLHSTAILLMSSHKKKCDAIAAVDFVPDRAANAMPRVWSVV
jgi:hypothetical protein